MNKARLIQLISHLYRRPNEMETMTSKSALRGRWLFFIAMTLVLVIPMGIALFSNILSWTNFKADIPLPRSQWVALYEETFVPCDFDATLSPACLANPINPKLWDSPLNRVDQQDHKRRVAERPEKEYWIGVALTPEQMREVLTKQANILVLGQILGTFRIWVNGKQLLSGMAHDNEPIALPIPIPWFGQSQPLRLAISIMQTYRLGDSPDLLEEGQRLGLTTKAGSTSWKRYYDFWLNSRPLVFFALNFLLGWLFFAIWSVAPEKAEYFYIAFMSMTFALFQMRYVEIYYTTLSRYWVNRIDMPMGILYAFAGMLAGFSFARLRPVILKFSFWFCLFLCAIAPFFAHDMRMLALITYYSRTTVANLANLIGGMACYLQAYYLYANLEDRIRLRLRIRRLMMFGTGLLISIALNQVVFAGGSPTILKMFFGKSGPFFLMLSLGLIALSEYRNQTKLAKSMPISKFHRLNPLPDFVRGALLHVDLKGSEKISRQGAKLGKAGDLLEMIVSHMWMAVSQNGGIVLQTEGDAILALFPAGEIEIPISAAFKAVDSMRENLLALEQRFLAQGITDMVPESGIHFRGAISEGDIRPIWQTYGGTRLASWAETGHGNALVESARLMELEREVAPKLGNNSTIVIVTEELKKNLPAMSFKGKWAIERETLLGKHGRPYDIAAYQIGTV